LFQSGCDGAEDLAIPGSEVDRAGFGPATSASLTAFCFVFSIFVSSEKSKAEALFKGLVNHKTGFYNQKKAKLSSKKSRNRPASHAG